MSPPSDDVARLAAGRRSRTFDGREALLDSGLARREVHLLTGGRTRLFAETPFGPHPVGDIPSPFVFDLRHAVGGAEGVCRAIPEAGAGAFVFGADEARGLLFDAGPAGGAFRRVVLASLTTSLREAIASLSRFFDPPAGPVAAAGPEPPPPTEEHPVDPSHAGALLDAAGLDPALLPALG